MSVRTRFAPSPTGLLHLGSIRTALFAWAYARNQNGTFILRIEDTDKQREVEGSVEHIMESLRWLGLDWDEGPGSGEHGPYLQSERLDLYRQQATRLIELGHAYADPYSAEQVDGFRAEAKQARQPFLYRRHRPDQTPEWDGSRPLRFKVPEVKRYEWQDEVRGQLSAGEEALDDFILIKADGYPTYNFAHVVDDHAMEISHVMRGEEFLASTPKFLSLYDAFGWEYPRFVTLPPVLNAQGGQKMSKRDGAKDVLAYREAGYLPESIVNFLASLGWNDGTDQEIYMPDEIVKLFTLDRIQKSPARFDPEKLSWMDWQHLKRRLEQGNPLESIGQLPGGQQLKSDLAQLGQTQAEAAIRLAASKANSAETLISQLQIFGPAPTLPPSSELLANIDQSLTPAEANRQLGIALTAVEGLDNPAAADFERVLRAEMSSQDLQPRIFLNLARWAVSGQRISPGLFDMMAVLGQAEVVARLKSARHQFEHEIN